MQFLNKKKYASLTTASANPAQDLRDKAGSLQSQASDWLFTRGKLAPHHGPFSSAEKVASVRLSESPTVFTLLDGASSPGLITTSTKPPNRSLIYDGWTD